MVNASLPAAVEENAAGNARARAWLPGQGHLENTQEKPDHQGSNCTEENKMTSLMDLSAVAPARTSVFHPEHPLHHLVLALAEQVDQAFEQWLVEVVPSSTTEELSVSE
jgi:hypothetical protein